MNFIRAIFVAACTLLIVVPVQADQTSDRLPALFEKLQSTLDTNKAERIEQQIWAIWGLPEERKASVPFASGVIAMQHGDYRGARLYFDKVVKTAPNFAEGWNKRATIAYALGDFEASVLDIQKTLALEPRHFGALSGLALIYEANGQEEAALDVLIQVKEIYPGMSGIDERMRDLHALIAAKKT